MGEKTASGNFQKVFLVYQDHLAHRQRNMLKFQKNIQFPCTKWNNAGGGLAHLIL